MYGRLAAVQEQLTTEHENLEAFVAELKIDFREGGVALNGVALGGRIRTQEMGSVASRFLLCLLFVPAYSIYREVLECVRMRSLMGGTSVRLYFQPPNSKSI